MINMLYLLVDIKRCAKLAPKSQPHLPEVNFYNTTSKTIERHHCPANIYLFKIKIKNTRKRYEICSKLTMKTSQRRHGCSSSVIIIIIFEHASRTTVECSSLNLFLFVSWVDILRKKMKLLYRKLL